MSAASRKSGDLETPDAGRLQTTPLVVDGTMYVVSPREKVIALDAATGKQKWTWDSGVATTAASRGLTWWTDGKERRLLTASASFIYAINPADGTTITTFGDKGRIDLRANLRGAPESNSYHATTPGVVYKDLLILGGRVSERTPASPGDERAYDVRSGELRWTFRTIPAAGEPGAETWPAGARETQGGANAWAGTIVDTQRGIVFIATGSPSDDFYGVDRPGDNLYSNCVIALDANTGKKMWHFQATRHDLWDSDFAAPPVLLHRQSQRPPHRCGRGHQQVRPGVHLRSRYRRVAVSDDRDEGAQEHRPWRDHLADATGSHATGAAVETDDDARRRDEPDARNARLGAEEFETFLGTDQPFTPLSIDKQTMVAPGWKGGVEWGGLSADPERGILYANVNNVFSLGSLTARGNAPARGGGGGARMKPRGAPQPSRSGGGQALHVHRLPLLCRSRGLPGQRVSVGHPQRDRHEYRQVSLDRAVRRTRGACGKRADRHGAGSHGGTVLTASGVLFTGGSEYDLKFRAYDSATGKVLWTGQAAWSRRSHTRDLRGQWQTVTW